MMIRFRRATATVVAALVGLLLAVLPMAAPASAHTGKLKLAVAGDGATGITIQATYADGHRLDKLVRLVVNATAEGGRTVGPIQLDPATEGQGFYATGPVLVPGRWQVTVTAPAPHPAKTTVQVEARAAQTPPPATARPEPVNAGPESVSAGSESAGGTRWWWTAGIGALAVVTVAAVALWSTARRRRPQP